MKLNCSNQRNLALTLIEVLVVVFVLLILVAILLPAPHNPKRMAQRINCVNNLKEIGLSYKLWEGDNNDKFPMAVSVTNGGAMELVAAGNVTTCFQVMSNELSTPKILLCPEDAPHTFATNFDTGFTSRNISYFVGAEANETNAQMFLSGDDNFEIGSVPVKSGLLEFHTNAPIAWSATRHKLAGNIGLTDGSVMQLSQTGLKTAIVQTGTATNRLAIP